MRDVGTQATFYVDLSPGVEGPVEGDFWRSTPGGSCYLVNQVSPSKSNPRRVAYVVTRLGRDAVGQDDPGVHLFWWKPRGRRR